MAKLSVFDQQNLTPAQQAQILAYKQAYDDAKAAGDATGMASANAAANAVRATKNYSGGVSGAEYQALPQQPNMTAPSAGLVTAGGTPEQYATPQLSGLTIGDTYGLNYDFNKILDILNKATETQYNAQEQATTTAENKFYDMLLGTTNTSMDTIRKNNAAAVATGASKGMSAANEISTLLGLQQQSVTNATDLANTRNLLSAEKNAALAKNTQSALDTSNTLKQSIASLDQTKYGYDTEGLAAKLSYLANLKAALAQIESAGLQADATKYNADANLTGTKYAADASASRYNNSYSSGGAGSSTTSTSTSGTSGTSGATPEGQATSTAFTGALTEGATITMGGKTYTVHNGKLHLSDQTLNQNIDVYNPIGGYLAEQVGGLAYGSTLAEAGGVVQDGTVMQVDGKTWTYNVSTKSWSDGTNKVSDQTMRGKLATAKNVTIK